MKNFVLNPGYIVGFIDGEGCFNISITKNPKMSAGSKIMFNYF